MADQSSSTDWKHSISSYISKLTYHTSGNITGLIIGIDCAVNAIYYMTLMGGIYANPMFFIPCAIASALMNAMLYAIDFPEAVEEFVHNIQKCCIHLYNWRAVMQDFSEKSIDEKKKIVYRHTVSFMKETIALASGIMLGLFTYSAYAEMHLLWISTPLIIICCFAYFLATYTLIRISLNATYIDKDTVKNKLEKFSNLQLVAVTLLTGIFLLATLWTIFTFYVGALSAIHAISSQLIPLTPILFGLLLIGEVIFSIKTAIWLCSEVPKPHKNTIFYWLMYPLILLNGLANAAITSYGSNKISGYTGFLLSVGVMYKSTHEINTETESSTDALHQNDTSTKKIALEITVYFIAIVAIIWLIVSSAPISLPIRLALICTLIMSCMALQLYTHENKYVVTQTSSVVSAVSMLPSKAFKGFWGLVQHCPSEQQAPKQDSVKSS